MNSQALAAPTLWILVIAFALAGPMLSVAPLGMAPLLITASVIAYVTERVRSGTWPRISSHTPVVLLALLMYCVISLIWTLNPKDGFRKLLDLAMIALSLSAMLALAERTGVSQRRMLAIALVGGMVAGLVLLGVETIFDFPLYRSVMGNSDPKLADLVESKRSVDALPLLVWPACLALGVLVGTWAGAALAVLFAVVCVKLTAASATLGMFVSLFVFALTFASVKWVRRTLAILTPATFILVIPIAFAAYAAGGTHAHWLKRSAQHRVEIWHFTAQRILDRPLFGYGFNASRDVPNGGAVSEFLAPDKPIIPLHPHDAFLQVWLELGAVGVLAVAALLLVGMGGIAKWPDNRARFALAGWTAGAIVAGLAFGIWQTWWMATLAFSAAAYRLIGGDHD